MLLTLSLVGSYLAWRQTTVPARPWLLEDFLHARLADCRKGSSAFVFRYEYERLAARSETIRSCLAARDGQWWIRRDYSPCVSMLLAAGLEAKTLSLKIARREEEQKARLGVLLPVLQQTLGDNRGGRIWEKFHLRSIELDRAKTLRAQAEHFHDQGEIGSAIRATLRALMSWRRFTQISDVEFARFRNTRQLAQWNEHAQRLLQWTLENGRRAILVDKLEHLCFLVKDGQVEKSYVANLGRKGYRNKVRAGDAATPEGMYKIVRKIPAGMYGFALLIDYPNSVDKARFASLIQQGEIPEGAGIGSDIEIHGRGQLGADWTDGCVSLNDSDMEELFRLAYVGMPVTIVGTTDWSTTIVGGLQNGTR